MAQDSNLETMKAKIREPFVRFVLPHNVLSVFHKYNKHVLTNRDIEAVKAETKNHGDAAGSEMMLDFLTRYKDWLPCLLTVLNDPEVKLSHVAAIIDELVRSPDDSGNVSETVMTEEVKLILEADEKVRKHHRHGPEYDFSLAEVEMAVSGLDGWHPNIKPKDVPNLLNKRKNGSYLWWYWKSHKRLAVSFIDENQLKTLIVHKTPRKKGQAECYYFFKNNMKDTLKDLINFHLSQGIQINPKGGNTQKHTIHLTHAMKVCCFPPVGGEKF